MIAITNLVKEYKLSKRQRKEWKTTESTVRAVDNITLSCQPGRVFSLLGPNGAGKTTTLRMISTILKPTQGTINVNGFDACSCVPDSFSFLPHQSAHCICFFVRSKFRPCSSSTLCLCSRIG